MRKLVGSLVLVVGCSASQVMTVEGPDLAAPAPRFSDEGMPAALAPVKQAVAAVDEQKITEAITRLAGYPTRNTCSDPSGVGGAIGAAREWILFRFGEIAGLKTRLHEFAVAACGGTRQSNVVAWLPGEDPNRLIVIGGHYDSRSTDGLDGKTPAPGANDSGSQTALVLESARVLAQAAGAGAKFKATLVFVAFAGEEQGTVGSAALVKDLPALFPGAHVEVMLNSDIVGGDNVANDAAALATFRLFSAGTPREIKGADGKTDDVSPSRNLMRAIGQATTAYVPAMTMLPKLREDRPGRGSDHEPFLAAGITAVRFIEPNETLAHQHTPDDRLEFVTPAYTARVTAVVVATAGMLASSPPPPAAVQVSGTAANPTVAFPGMPVPGWHYVLAARAVADNAYSARLRVVGAEPLVLSAAALHREDGGDYYLSVALSDGAGHESLFAYPEIRCDTAGCAAPADAANVTATK